MRCVKVRWVKNSPVSYHLRSSRIVIANVQFVKNGFLPDVLKDGWIGEFVGAYGANKSETKMCTTHEEAKRLVAKHLGLKPC